jgi:hypothetical protein
MTPQQWKRLTTDAIIRRRGDDQEYKVYKYRDGTIAIQYPLGPRPPEGRGWAWSGRVVADPDNWELVMTAAQRRRLEAQWRKDDPEDEDKEEEDDDEQDA